MAHPAAVANLTSLRTTAFGYGVLDFKTDNPSAESSLLYSWQLHAYAYALEHLASGALSLSPVGKLGLLYFYRSSVSQQNLDGLSYNAEIAWIEVEKRETRFLESMDEVLTVLELPEPPTHWLDCHWCGYTKRLSGL